MKKYIKCIAAVMLICAVCFSFASCIQLDEIKEASAVIKEDGTIEYCSKIYKQYDTDYDTDMVYLIMDSCDDYISITADDVPLLLRDSFFQAFGDGSYGCVNADKTIICILSSSDVLGDIQVYCLADKYNEITAEIANIQPDYDDEYYDLTGQITNMGLDYRCYESYSEEDYNINYNINYKLLSERQFEAVDSALSGYKISAFALGVVADDGLGFIDDFVPVASIYKCDEDMLTTVIECDVFKWNEEYYIKSYEFEGEDEGIYTKNIFIVPDEYTEDMEKLTAV